MTAPGGRRDLDRTEILRLLAKVDDVLTQHGQSVVVYVVGGANISLTVDESRTTVDIDAVIRSGYDALLDAARTVAESEPGLPEDWINADFTGGDNPTGGLFWQWFDERDRDLPVELFRGHSLVVEGASPLMMLALKTLGHRAQGVQDTFTLMRLTGLRTPQEIGRNLARFTGERINLARFTGERIFHIQGSDAVYPRIDPEFRHIFDNLPADLRTLELPAAPQKTPRTWMRRRTET